MGNETSYQEKNFPILAFEAPPGHSQIVEPLPDTLQHDGCIRRQESLPSETEYTDSSDNSNISRRLQFPGNNKWLRTTSGTCGIPSTEKGSFFDSIVKRISGRQNQNSSSDEDQTCGTRDVSSAASLQDSACEILETSPLLTMEEKAKIKDVLNRVKQLENREAKRISDLETDLQHREQEVSRRVVASAQDIYGYLSGCEFCDSSTLFETFEGRRLSIWQCYDCGRRTCTNCCIHVGLNESNDATVICSLCQRRRRLIASSGAWTRRKSFEPTKSTIPMHRAHSCGDSLEPFDVENTSSRWIETDKPLSAPRITITSTHCHQDSISQNLDDSLPTLTVKGPKSLEFSNNLPSKISIRLRSPQRLVKAFSGEDILLPSDSECPDTEGVKSLFLPNRICSSPANPNNEMIATDYDHHSEYMDDMMAEYYSDSWRYCGPETPDIVSFDDTAKDEEDKTFRTKDPSFGPISEEAEEELTEMHQSFSNIAITTTTTTSNLQSPIPLNQRLISHHLSLEHVNESRMLPNRSHSFPLLVKLEYLEGLLLPKISNEAAKYFQCEVLSPGECGFHLAPVVEQDRGSLRRVRVGDPPKICGEVNLKAYAIANWSANSLIDDKNVKIIAGYEDEDDEEDEEASYKDGEREEYELPQIKRCQNFENINKLIASGSSLYPLLEEGSNEEGESRPSSPALSDGKPIHRWGRQTSQQATSNLSFLPPSVTSYAEDQVLLKQEEQLWASLFEPSEHSFVEFTKGFTAQLHEMSHQVEVAVEANTQLTPPNVVKNVREDLQLSKKNQSCETESTAPTAEESKSPKSPLHLCERVELQGKRLLPRLPLRGSNDTAAGRSNVDVGAASSAPEHREVKQTSESREISEVDTQTTSVAPHDSATDMQVGTGYRSQGGGTTQPINCEQTGEADGKGDLSIKYEGSSPTHRPKVTTTPPSPSSTTHYPYEESNALLLPNALVHHSSRASLPLREQHLHVESFTVATGEEEPPLSLFTEPVRPQFVEHSPLLVLDSPVSETHSHRSGVIGSCLWSVLCRSKSRQFDRAIRTLTEASEDSASFLESTDTLLTILQSETEPTKTGRRVVAKTRRLRLTQICDTTIEEQCSFLPPSEQHIEIATAQHLISNLTYENPLLLNMTSSLRAKRSQSYIAPNEFDYSYARQQQHHAHPRLPDVPPHRNSTSYTKRRSFTISSMPRNIASSQRYGDNDGCDPSIWSPPPGKSISAGLSPKQVRMIPGQLNPRTLSSRDNLTLSSLGFALRQSAPNGSYQRVNRYSGSMLDDYASGDSGGSNSSYRKRLLEQKKHGKTPSSARISGDVSLMRTGYESALANRSATLPYKRRGSWHVERESSLSELDRNNSRNPWDRSRWRSFSPERSIIDTAHEGGPPAISSETRSLRSQSLHNKHLRELAKSTEQLSTGFLDNYKGIETSFNTLRAKLNAASVQTSGFQRQASADRLYGRESTAEQLRRQREREHRRLLKNLMSDSWEKGIDRHRKPPQQYFNQAPNVVLPVQETTLLTAPRTTNPLANPNLEKLLRNPALMQLLVSHAAQTHQTPDQSSLADQVTLAAVAGAAAATAMANFTSPANEQASYSNLPSQTTSSGGEYDWNDPETLMAAYTALAEASGGEKAFLEQLSPELAATLVHYREQLSEKLSAAESGRVPIVTSASNAVVSTATSTPSGVVMLANDNAALNDSGTNQPGIMLEDVSRQAGMESDNILANGRSKLPTTTSSDVAGRSRAPTKSSDLTTTKLQRRSYDFPTKRLLLMRSSKGRSTGGNGFGLNIVGGRQRPDGRLGSYVEQIHSGETLGYLHGEISEGDEVIEWNGVSLIGKGPAEVQAIVDTPADEVELLVRVIPPGTPTPLCYSQEFPQHTCSRRTPCTADVHHYPPPKLCPSHNPNPHLHDSLHGGSGSVGSCVHQQHTCQQSQQGPRGGSMHTCEVHPMGPACIHKQQQQQHVCRSSDWSSSDIHGPYSQRGIVDQPPPNSPQSERNASEASASPSVRTGSIVHRQQRQVVPTVNVAEYDVAGDRVAADTVSHNSGGQLNDDGNSVNDVDTKQYGEIELILTFDDYDQSLTVHVARARGLRPMDLNGLADPFVKLRLHPDPTEDMDLNRQIKYIANTLEPEWQQTVVFMNCLKRTLKKRVLEVTVWDFDRLKMNDFMGQAIIHLGSKEALNGQPHWYRLCRLQDIVIPGYRQPGTRSVAPPISQNDQVKTIKLVKEIKNPQTKGIHKGRSH